MSTLSNPVVKRKAQRPCRFMSSGHGLFVCRHCQSLFNPTNDRTRLLGWSTTWAGTKNWSDSAISRRSICHWYSKTYPALICMPIWLFLELHLSGFERTDFQVSTSVCLTTNYSKDILLFENCNGGKTVPQTLKGCVWDGTMGGRSVLPQSQWLEIREKTVLWCFYKWPFWSDYKTEMKTLAKLWTIIIALQIYQVRKCRVRHILTGWNETMKNTLMAVIGFEHVPAHQVFWWLSYMTTPSEFWDSTGEAVFSILDLAL